MSGQALADAASALAGTRFRLQGRDPATGLDCIGVLAAALGAIGREVRLPATYTLRTRDAATLEQIAAGCGLVAAVPPVRAGDVLLARVSGCQSHVLVALGLSRFIHAHAGLRRVVVLDGPLPWMIAGWWRLAGEE